MDDPSLTSLKQTFIQTQVRLLSTPLEPNTSWRDLAPPLPIHESPLSDKLIGDLVAKANDKIKQHNRLIFSTQSQRHVAEQIDSLHWNLVAEEMGDMERDTVVVRRDAELADSKVMRTLPEEFEDLFVSPDCEVEEDEAERYTQLRQELLELSERRDMLKKRLVKDEQLRRLTEPLDAPLRNLQPNLVTKDGELSRELDRMRVLLARVSGRVGSVGVSPATHRAVDGTIDTAAQTNQQRLARVMELG